MTEARAEILARLPRSVMSGADVPRASEPDAPIDRNALVSQFVDAAAARGMLCERVSGAGAGRLSIMAALRRAGVAQVYASRAVDDAVPGLLDAMAVLEIDAIILETESQRVADAAAQPKPVAVGLTVAAAAWADAGTVVLRFAEPRSALAYVWPPCTFILLPVARLFDSRRAWVTHLRQTDQLEAMLAVDLSFVSGPTATSDVAFDEVAGVYGATEIRVIVVEPEIPL